MDEILNMNINEMANVSFNCSCGKTHRLDIRKIVIGSNVISELPSILKDFKCKKFIYRIKNLCDFKDAAAKWKYSAEWNFGFG